MRNDHYNKKIRKFANLRAVFFAIWIFLSVSAYSQITNGNNDKLLVFQKFVNGEIPVKEAVVYRRSEKYDGAVLNQEWWRFGYQNGTWYCQRLEPEANNPTNLVPKPMNTVCGASFAQYWTIDDSYIDLAENSKVKGSSPDTYAQGYRSLMFAALSLGLPRISDVLNIDDAQIQWNNLAFTTVRASKFDEQWNILGTATTKGRLILGDNDEPSSAEFSGVNQETPAGSVTYEFDTTNTTGVPNAFLVKYPDHRVGYRFLRITLGASDLTKTDGYAPALFADMSIARTIRIWTNSHSYTLNDGRFIPNFETAHPKRIGPLILIVIIVTAGFFLTLWYRHSKTTQ